MYTCRMPVGTQIMFMHDQCNGLGNFFGSVKHIHINCFGIVKMRVLKTRTGVSVTLYTYLSSPRTACSLVHQRMGPFFERTVQSKAPARPTAKASSKTGASPPDATGTRFRLHVYRKRTRVKDTAIDGRQHFHSKKKKNKEDQTFWNHPPENPEGVLSQLSAQKSCKSSNTPIVNDPLM